jgi:hypothetical protein
MIAYMCPFFEILSFPKRATSTTREKQGVEKERGALYRSKGIMVVKIRSSTQRLMLKVEAGKRG